MAEPMTPRQPDRTDDAGIAANWGAMAGAAVGYFRARAELAGIESKEALAHYLKILAVLAAGVAGVAFGYLFFCLGCVFAIARLFENPNAWIWIALAVALAHF